MGCPLASNVIKVDPAELDLELQDRDHRRGPTLQVRRRKYPEFYVGGMGAQVSRGRITRIRGLDIAAIEIRSLEVGMRKQNFVD